MKEARDSNVPSLACNWWESSRSHPMRRAFYSLHQLEPKGSARAGTGASGVGMAGQWEDRSQTLGAYGGLGGLGHLR